MSKNVIKLLFIVLLVFQNNLYASVYDTGCDNCTSYAGGCTTTTYNPSLTMCTNNRFYCFEEDQLWANYRTRPTLTGCQSVQQVLKCPGGSLSSDCGCWSPWVAYDDCQAVCYGYYSVTDSNGIRVAKQAKYTVGPSAIYDIDPPSSCNSRDFKYTCKAANGYYAPPGITVRCQVDISTVIRYPSELNFTNCEGCEYCDETAEGFINAGAGYQQGRFYEFKYNGSQYVCEPTGEATGNWRCAPGYYQGEGDDPETEPNIVCKACPAGTYNPNVGATEETACIPCDAGSTTFTESGGVLSYSTGQSSVAACKLCPVGYYEDGKKCKKCSEESGYKYQDEAGQTTCKDCPVAFIIDKSVLTTSKTQCYINPNIKLKDSLGTIDLKDEIGSAKLYYVGP